MKDKTTKHITVDLLFGYDKHPDDGVKRVKLSECTGGGQKECGSPKDIRCCHMST